MAFIGDNGVSVWCALGASGGSTIEDSIGISSCSRVQSGTHQFNFSSSFGNNDYCVLAEAGCNRDTWADGDDANDQGCIVLKKYTSYVRLGGPDWDDGAAGDPHKYSMAILSTTR